MIQRRLNSKEKKMAPTKKTNDEGSKKVATTKKPQMKRPKKIGFTLPKETPKDKKASVLVTLIMEADDKKQLIVPLQRTRSILMKELERRGEHDVRISQAAVTMLNVLVQNAMRNIASEATRLRMEIGSRLAVSRDCMVSAARLKHFPHYFPDVTVMEMKKKKSKGEVA